MTIINVAEACKIYKAMLTAPTPQQEAQEPVVAAVFDEQLGRPMLVEGAPMLSHGQPLYTAPQTQPAALSDDVVKDAARWRMVALISNELRLGPEKSTHTSVVYAFMDATDNGADLTGAVDAALAVHRGTA